MKLKLGLFFALYISASLGFSTQRESFVVSSTEPSNESSSDVTSTKEDGAPIVPKIYEMKVDTNVTNRFAKTSVVSKVKNLGKTAQEATFSVVLPETAYISGFVMRIGGKNYKTYVKKREEAKQIYDEAVERGQAAAHVKANARDSNRFTVSLNMEPQKKAIFTLTYEELLQRQNERYEIVINIHPGQPVKDLSVEVHIDESKPLKFVKSPSLRAGNEISKNDDKLASLAEINQANSTSAIVKFHPNIHRQKQLATGLGTKKENGLAGQFVVQYDVERNPNRDVLLKDGYFVHFFAPSDVPALPKYVIFILDTSGSMTGIKIEQLKEAMNSILGELKKDDLFNIVEFNTDVKVWNIDNIKHDYEEEEFPWSAYQNLVLPPGFPANKENIKKAKKVVRKLQGNELTDIQSALEIGLKLVKKNKSNHQPIIVFLTDGQPNFGAISTHQIISDISEINTGKIKTPIFSLSFGDGADREFLQKLSLKNLGFARHIYEAADASLQLQEFYKQISSPLLNNVNFKYVSNVTKLTKTDFPIYFSGSELVVAGVADGDFTPPTIERNGIKGPLIWRPKIEATVGDLERLWAYLTIKQILEARDAAEEKDSHTKKALDIALKYSFVTPVSSLVVVKPNDTTAVDTEDASKPIDRPEFDLQTFFSPPLGNRADSTPIYSVGSQDNFRGSDYYIPNIREYDIPITAALYGEYIPPSTTQLPKRQDLYKNIKNQLPWFRDIVSINGTETLPIHYTTKTQDLYKDIKNQLPWLRDILSENGTVTLPTGNYQIGSKKTIIPANSQCPKTPINGPAGVCTLLPKCPQVFSLLTDLRIFQSYYCTLNTYVGVCCPIASSRFIATVL